MPTTLSPTPAAHTLSLLVENKSGVLARIAGLIAAKGYNIDSLSVGTTHDPSISQMTIVLRGDDAVIEQALKQLNRLIDVIRVSDLTAISRIERELILIRVSARREERAELCRLAEIFAATIVDTTTSCFTIELVGSGDKLDDFADLLEPFGIRDLYRTGLVAMPRAKKKHLNPKNRNQKQTRSEPWPRSSTTKTPISITSDRSA